MLEDLHCRLSGVVIECLDYLEFIERYDSSETLFYLDPPYFGCENDYGKSAFERVDFAHMAEKLTNIDGRFILSLNDVPEIRSTFHRFEMISVETTYSVSNCRRESKKAGELLISNFPL